MTDDLAAARERHTGEHACIGAWADEDTIYDGDCDAARFSAIADELAEALRWMHETAHDFCDDPYPCSARAALAKWEASR